MEKFSAGHTGAPKSYRRRRHGVSREIKRAGKTLSVRFSDGGQTGAKFIGDKTEASFVTGNGLPVPLGERLGKMELAD